MKCTTKQCNFSCQRQTQWRCERVNRLVCIERKFRNECSCSITHTNEHHSHWMHPNGFVPFAKLHSTGIRRTILFRLLCTNAFYKMKRAMKHTDTHSTQLTRSHNTMWIEIRIKPKIYCRQVNNWSGNGILYAWTPKTHGSNACISAHGLGSLLYRFVSVCVCVICNALTMCVCYKCMCVADECVHVRKCDVTRFEKTKRSQWTEKTNEKWRRKN